MVGAAAGGIAGAFVGGVGGRLAMLLLRLTSPDAVIGMTSDDGFEIGVVTTQTVTFIFGMAMLGGVGGVLYSAARMSIRPELRLPLWTLANAAVGGAGVVHEDGIDFRLLEPAALAIALFVALPAVAAVVTVTLVERWVVAEPWADRRLAGVVVAGSLVGTFALVGAFAIIVAAVALNAIGVARVASRAGRVVLPLALVGATVYKGAELVDEVAQIL
jgi:hypothetical protein